MIKPTMIDSHCVPQPNPTCRRLNLPKMASTVMHLTLASLLSLAVGQQIYIPADGPTERPQCPAASSTIPSYRYTPFSYTMTETVRYATSVALPTTTQTYAAPPESLISLVPSLSYTTWGKWDPNATTSARDADDAHGQAAWTALWKHANPPGFTETSIYSTTVSPTPVPSGELVLPPRDYFGPQDCYNFPPGFTFGVASSASQIEGATADEGKAPSLMDILSQNHSDYVTNEHYYYYKQDIERVAAMGVKHFSFSVAWTRILPFALPGTPVNRQAVDHYNDVIDFIISRGMVPEVTLLHFDTPLQFFGDDLGAIAEKPTVGYTNGGYQNATFPGAFVNYAKIVMSHFADRVPVWYTFNEPLLYSQNGVAVYNVLKAHAEVYHFYKEVLNGTGKVALKLNNNFGCVVFVPLPFFRGDALKYNTTEFSNTNENSVPRDPTSESDIYAADHFNSFQLGLFCNPIFLGQDYPDSFKQTISDHVPLTAEDLAYMNGTADFLGIDPYTATVVAPPEPGSINSILDCAADNSSHYRPYCVNQTTLNIYGWDIGYRSQSYVYLTPTYLRSYLNYLHNTWRTPVVITEFGFPVFGEEGKELADQLFDTPRSLYYLSFLSEVLKAIWEDGVEVGGAFAWSFADNWEFGDYAQHFGIQTVNRTTQERRYKKSFFDLVDFMTARGVE